MKIAIIQTHPIQHFCPQFDSYSGIFNIETKVIFAENKGLQSYFDEQFNKEIKWQGIDLSNFNHIFLDHHKSISEVLTDYDPHVVIIYGYTKPIQKKSRQWALRNKKSICYISDTENHQRRNKLKQLIKRIYLKHFFKKIDIIFSIGDANEDFYKWCGVNNTKIIRMFFPIHRKEVDKVFAKKHQYLSKIRKKYAIENDEIIISNIGKLVSWKSQEDIIKLLKFLEKKNIKCTAFMMGSGIDETKLRHQASTLDKNRVIFTGFIQPKEMMQFLSATDIYVHTAKIEPHSLAISEAIYLGCPVILSNTCGSYGSTDDVQIGKNGFVYKHGDIVELSNYVETLNSNRHLLQEFSEASVKISRHNQNLAHGEALKAAVNIIRGQ